MIRIDSLTKIYKAKAKTTCKALDNVSLTLPDKGLVFVLGKSGSGKSTLLNLIGGLDSFDGGDIISFGNSLKSFNERGFEAYRSDCVSFIFQDYHLIDELTVLENITLFNSEEVDPRLLADTLETVGMQEYVNRYPSELSGGQKQRVAIARGIIKGPKVILCDEPTGNLDRKTSGQILALLKKLSEDKLVVIVSHNLTEAETFADRIIELADGRIVEDRSRDKLYTDGFVVGNGVATLPYHERMSDANLSILNEGIRSGEITEVKLNKSGFEDSRIEYVENKKTLEMRKLTGRNVMRLFRKFFFAKYRAAIFTVLLSVIMFGLFSIIQSFISFNSDEALLESLGEGRHSVVAITKDYDGFPVNIYEDLSALAGEKIYPLYSQTLWLNNSRGSSWDNVSRMGDEANLSELYIHENYGLLLCDREYLLDLYGVDGEIPLVEGSLEDAYGTGLLITDYFADSIIYHEVEYGGKYYFTYESLIGVFNPCGVNTAGRIAGIIDTDYEEKYKDIFDSYDEYVKAHQEIDYDELEEIIRSDPRYVQFADDVIVNLGIAYSLNPDYVDSFDLDEMTLVRCSGLYFSSQFKEEKGKGLSYFTTINTPITCDDIGTYDIGLPYTIYNSIYGTDYTDADLNKLNHIVPQDVVVRRYVDDDPTKPLVYEFTLHVTFLTSVRPVVSREMMLEFKKADWQPSAIYVNEIADVSTITGFVVDNEFMFIAREQQNLQQINELITTFHDLFRFLEIVIISIIAMYLILFGVRSIRQNSYQIGVIKALGGRNRDVEKIFVLKTFIIGVIIALLSALISTFFVEFANDVLLSSIELGIGMKLDNVTIIRFRPSLIAFDAGLMIVVAFVSALLPALLLKRIKPVEIIKAKE